jgi:ABC-2 type transport system ATP-binding protein
MAAAIPAPDDPAGDLPEDTAKAGADDPADGRPDDPADDRTEDGDPDDDARSTSADGDPVIEAIGLTKEYGSTIAVDDLSFEVYPGEVFGLLGPNGAGKTTTVLMLLGLTDPTAGEARVVGVDPNRDPLAVKSRVGYLPDSVGFYENLTGRQNLEYTARLNRVPRTVARERISALLDQVRLADAADHKVGTYSRGMRQRLGIADALVKDPAVLILDEPTVSLDPEGVSEVLELIGRIAAERGIAILLSSHLLDQVQAVCHRVGIFYAGRLVAVGTLEELAAQAAGEVPVASGGAAADEIVEVAADGISREILIRALRATPVVRAVEADPDRPNGWLARIEAGDTAALAAALLAAGVPVTHFRHREQGLDAIYRQLVHAAADDVAAGAAAAAASAAGDAA